jgi:hypothetical protein
MSGTLALTRSLMDFIPNPGLRPVSGYNGVEYQVSPFLRAPPQGCTGWTLPFAVRSQAVRLGFIRDTPPPPTELQAWIERTYGRI